MLYVRDLNKKAQMFPLIRNKSLRDFVWLLMDGFIDEYRGRGFKNVDEMYKGFMLYVEEVIDEWMMEEEFDGLILEVGAGGLKTFYKAIDFCEYVEKVVGKEWIIRELAIEFGLDRFGEERIREGLIIRVDEAIPLERVYRGSYEYRIKQPAMQDRVGAGERLKGHIRKIFCYVYSGARLLYFTGNVESEREPKEYSFKIQFYDLLIDEEFSEMTPVKVLDAKRKEEFYVQRVTPDTEVAVFCSCPDFRYRWEWYLREIGGLLGKARPYIRKTARKGQNVAKVKTVCKHLFVVFEIFATVGFIGLSERSAKEIDLSWWLDVK